MAAELINADFSRRVVLDTEQLPWHPSPQAGIERRLLDRIGGEIARATSIVRYAPGSNFPAHIHGGGEEFLVLSGVFSDELGDYPQGTYIRNPPGSGHAPRTVPGCIIFVKLRQMGPRDLHRIVIHTSSARLPHSVTPGHSALALHTASDALEVVTFERLDPGVKIPGARSAGGEEILIVSGSLEDDEGRHGAGTWIRNPPGYRTRLSSPEGAVFYRKRGHLAVADRSRDGRA